MSKPMSEDAILVAKALKNFDPDKYCWYDVTCCVAGQYKQVIDCKTEEEFYEWRKLSRIVEKVHQNHYISFVDGKGIAAKLREVYELGSL